MYQKTRNKEYINQIKQFINDNYKINVMSIEVCKRGYMAETYIIKTSEKDYFLKIVYYEFHKDIYANSLNTLEYLNNKNIQDISKTFKSIDNKNYLSFDNGILAIFEYVPGMHSDDYDLNKLFDIYANLYKIEDTNINIDKEIFDDSVIKLFDKKCSDLVKQKKVEYFDLYHFLSLNDDLINRYKYVLRKLCIICKESLDKLYITHGDGQGNVIVNNDQITLIDWDTVLLAPIERDAWVFLQNNNNLELFQQSLIRNNIDYPLKKEMLYYYTYKQFFYYLTEYFEMLDYIDDKEKIEKAIGEIKDLFSNWMFKCMSIANEGIAKIIGKEEDFMKREIPDLNIFMVCEKLNKQAFREMPKGYHIRYCREDELDIWKAMPFNDEKLAEEYYDYMTEYYNKTYLPKGNLFYETCLFVCDENDKPIATGFAWKQYDKYMTIHWIKTLKGYEGIGIGRALLTYILKNIDINEFPVYLHTQPGSYRAIKLYSDFGFKLIDNPAIIDNRKNESTESLTILEEYMPKEAFDKLEIVSYDEDTKTFKKLLKRY